MNTLWILPYSFVCVHTPVIHQQEMLFVSIFWRCYITVDSRVAEPHWFNADPDPAFFLIVIRNLDLDSGSGFDDLKLKKIYSWKFLFLFSWSKIAIYLSLGLYKGRPSCRRSLQPSKRTSSTSTHNHTVLFSIFVGHFCPGYGSGSATQIKRIWIRIRIRNPGGFCNACTLKRCITFRCNTKQTMLLNVAITYAKLNNDNLSRRLQPGYNYVGQTNDRQPLLISAVGRLRDYLPTADCCVGPGRHAPNPPSTLIPAVGCRSRILKHWSRKWARRKKPPAKGSSKNRTIFYTVIIIVYCVFI